ncbi:hypothetical protein [Rhodoferax sp.]|uniref:hypothetical protein n=1 Tax=Rhodoferax sp. TaxID=50421 RepID=UPI0028516213|nr:hypothetical protein [Rhodoferax sp.]MDR3370901.1 hypothetical protein [Rhodoferax sp.]
MEISVLKPAVDGKLEVSVRYYEQIDGLGHNATLTVWVPETDSRSELEKRARLAAESFLKQCLLAHSAQDR